VPEYLILKLEGDDPRSAKVTSHVVHDGELADALPQGYEGDGRYAIVNWSERTEGDLTPGPVEVAAVEGRVERAEAAAQAEKDS